MRFVPIVVALAASACHTVAAVPPVAPCECVETPAGLAASRFEQGDEVEIRFHDSWFAGHVLSVVGPQRWEVAYDDYDSDWNMVVGPDRIRARQQEGQGPEAPDPAAPGTAVTSASELRQGGAVHVLYGSTWYPGVVRGTTQDGQVEISYVGYGDEWNETVSLDRVRLPQ